MPTLWPAALYLEHFYISVAHYLLTQGLMPRPTTLLTETRPENHSSQVRCPNGVSPATAQESSCTATITHSSGGSKELCMSHSRQIRQWHGFKEGCEGSAPALPLFPLVPAPAGSMYSFELQQFCFIGKEVPQGGVILLNCLQSWTV